MMGSPENNPGLYHSPDATPGSPFPLYPTEGFKISKEITEAKEAQLWDVVRKGLAWSEGLKTGLHFNINKGNSDYIFLNNLMTTNESGTARPSTFYVFSAIEQRLQEAAWETETGKILDENDPDRKRTINLSVPEMEKRLDLIREISNHVEARKLVDTAFLQRMMAAAVDKDFSGLVGKDPLGHLAVTPDKGHWQSFFGSSETGPIHEWGNLVDLTMRGIEACGLTPTEEATFKMLGIPSPKSDPWKIQPEMFTKGIKNRDEFTRFYSYLDTVSGGRPDVIWAAWKVMLTWEEISELGCKDGDIGFPPFVASLFAYLAHPEEKLAQEWAGSKIGTDDRPNHTKWISHSGYPWIATHITEALGGKNKIVGSFIRQTNIKEKVLDASGAVVIDRNNGKEKKQDVSLYDIWGKRGVSFASPEFPWTETDLPLTPHGDESPAGGMGTWRLNIARGSGVVDMIKATPSVDDMAKPDFFTNGDRDNGNNLLRVTDKLLRDRAPEFRKHILLNWLLPKRPTDKVAPVAKGEVAYITKNINEYWSTFPTDSNQDHSETSLNKILFSARSCGWIDVDGEKFIRDALGR